MDRVPTRRARGARTAVSWLVLLALALPAWTAAAGATDVGAPPPVDLPLVDAPSPPPVHLPLVDAPSPPPEVRVPIGTTVIWSSATAEAHALRAMTVGAGTGYPVGEPSAGAAPGETISHRFDQPGEHWISCELHGGQTVVAVVIVEEVVAGEPAPVEAPAVTDTAPEPAAPAGAPAAAPVPPVDEAPPAGAVPVADAAPVADTVAADDAPASEGALEAGDTSAPDEAATDDTATDDTASADVVPAPPIEAPPTEAPEAAPAVPAAEPPAPVTADPKPYTVLSSPALAPALGGGFPAHLKALQDTVARTGPNSTRELLAAYATHGIGNDDAVRLGFGRFPVGGLASYTHDWWFPRHGPGWRLHQGTDIFAAKGTPVRAPASGRVSIAHGGLGGLSVKVTESDGTYWYLAHLEGVAPAVTDGMEVAAGTTVGFVGDSGNARGGLPHLHIELHPGGGAAVDPKPVLDQLIAEAVAAVPNVVAMAAPQAPAPAEAGTPAPPVGAEAPEEAGATVPVREPIADPADQPVPPAVPVAAPADRSTVLPLLVVGAAALELARRRRERLWRAGAALLARLERCTGPLRSLARGVVGVRRPAAP